ncbi:hypothetical protein [Dickeya lacustris]|uniref:Uncharacterized protein n=1 Tax=Dickeya lacustris TaxID=2259638 RepID=A0ABY8G9K8_9GAMM|nr:hypothetical protein [Dickeya lacustris]WFN56642.1 hypothetical protein O1Q98_05025 [Dickeya lacustris]
MTRFHTLTARWAAGIGLLVGCFFTASAVADKPAPSSQASPFRQWLYWSDTKAYEKATGADLSVVRQETRNGFGISWWREPKSGVTYPQITSGYTANTRTQLNNVLNAAMHTMLFEKKGDCSEGATGKASHELSLIWVSPKVISYQIKAVLDCGAEGKQVLFSTRNIATETVKRLSIDDVLLVRDIPASALLRNQLIEIDHRVPALTHWLQQQFQARYSQCSYFFDSGEEEEFVVWSDDVWALTPQGIRFYPALQDSGFHLRATDKDDVEQTCRSEEAVVLPWSLLQANPGPLTKTVMP